MTQPSPADTLRAAADKLRRAPRRGVQTAVPDVAALLRAREPLAQWLENTAHSIDATPFPATDPYALAVARAILGEQP